MNRIRKNKKRKYYSVNPCLKSLLLILCLLASPLSSRELSWDRVEVIAPSTPDTDVYTQVVVAARTEAWGIDPSFQGEAWLWSDGPYIRPFHVKFAAKNKGVMAVPLKFDMPVMQRIEAYWLTGVIQTWSNPVVPVEPGYQGLRLYWGKLGDCAEPGLEFCVSDDDELEAKSAVHGIPGNPVVLPALLKQAGDETWWILLNPGLARKAKESLRERIKNCNGRDELMAVVKDSADDLLPALVYAPPSRGAALIRKVPGVSSLLGPKNSDSLPPGLLVWSGPDDKSERLAEFLRRTGPDLAAALVSGQVRAVVPDQGGLIGVWSRDREATSLWNALRQGNAYASWGGRIIVDWAGHLTPGKGSQSIMVAGYGPREEAAVFQAEADALNPVMISATDDFKMELPLDGKNLRPGPRCLLAVDEPGSPRNGHALAGPLLMPQ